MVGPKRCRLRHPFEFLSRWKSVRSARRLRCTTLTPGRGQAGGLTGRGRARHAQFVQLCKTLPCGRVRSRTRPRIIAPRPLGPVCFSRPLVRPSAVGAGRAAARGCYSLESTWRIVRRACLNPLALALLQCDRSSTSRSKGVPATELNGKLRTPELGRQLGRVGSRDVCARDRGPTVQRSGKRSRLDVHVPDCVA